jgi:oligoendopeptidase F
VLFAKDSYFFSTSALKFNKSELMKRAHKIAKCIKTYHQPLAKYAALLADAIRQAWREFRKAIEKAILDAKPKITARTTQVMDMDNAAIAAEYTNAHRGQYFGD